MKQTFHEELTEAFGEAGCALCRLGARTVARYLDILAYENVNDVALRETIREGLGLCNRHAWQFVQDTRAPLGTAIIYRDLIRTLQQRTARALGPADGVPRRLEGLLPKRHCVACDALATSIKDCAYQVHRSWVDSVFRAAYAASDGLCWSHLLATLDADRFARHWREILAAQHRCLDRRIGRALRDESAAPLLEALASAPRLNGTRIEAIVGESGLAISVGDEVIPTVENGWCPVCAALERWHTRGREKGPGREEPGLPCAVHAWHRGRARDEDDLSALAERLHALDERLTIEISVDLAGPAVLRVAERIRRGSVLPSEVTAGLDCPTCSAQLSYESSVVARLEATTLCVPHLRVAAYHAPAYDQIRTETRRVWRTIETQLDEVIRKYDYRFQREPKGEEQASPRWAVAVVAGVEGMR
jgi:hypothetical protein